MGSFGSLLANLVGSKADKSRANATLNASASAPAPAGGYPSAAAGIIGYPPPKGLATDQLEGLPSGRRGTCTSPV
ncbi:hypothetical protein PGTUg99_029254 [Puccinia graminis f. sp. tritici]|uniref:Uncharacterized protein n=1 Tax=Puccinia graminis f. sp. tritici TaxID=56615 RepID=A0A5B0RMR7_PUCGR|nr:hypothetical protein PGTUg99_029254 [Puccinia graminis f. sp. tritici]